MIIIDYIELVKPLENDTNLRKRYEKEYKKLSKFIKDNNIKIINYKGEIIGKR